MLRGVGRVQCEVTRDCRFTAYAQIRIAGMGVRYMTNACRQHSPIVIGEYLLISNDVRIRKAV